MGTGFQGYDGYSYPCGYNVLTFAPPPCPRDVVDVSTSLGPFPPRRDGPRHLVAVLPWSSWSSSCPPPSPLAPALPPHEQLLAVAGAGAGPWSRCRPSPSPSPSHHRALSVVVGVVWSSSSPLLIVPALSLLSGHRRRSPVFVIVSRFPSPCSPFPPREQLLAAVVGGAVTLVVLVLVPVVLSSCRLGVLVLVAPPVHPASSCSQQWGLVLGAGLPSSSPRPSPLVVVPLLFPLLLPLLLPIVKLCN